MTLAELKLELEKDLPINLTDIQWESANNPVIYGKWVRYLAEYKVQHKRALNKRSKAKKVRLDYYTGRGDDICLDQYAPSEMKTVLEASQDYMKADTEAELVDIMVDFCKGALDAVKHRGYAIKVIVEQRILESGK